MSRRATAIVRTNSNGIEHRRARERRARDLHEAVDRHRIRVRRQRGQRVQQAGALFARFAHADDAAAAGLHARVAHVRQRVQAILEFARVDDLAVEIRRGVDVVVVVVQAGVAQGVGLVAGEHAERRAGFQAERLHLADHRGDLRDVAVLRRAPRGAHAEARGAGVARLAGLRDHVLGAHELRGFHARVVARGLRAVAAVLGAAAGLHGQQRGDLDLGRVEVFAMDRGRAMQQLGEGQREKREHFVAGPVVAHLADSRHGSFPTAMAIQAGQSGNHVSRCQPTARSRRLTGSAPASGSGFATTRAACSGPAVAWRAARPASRGWTCAPPASGPCRGCRPPACGAHCRFRIRGRAALCRRRPPPLQEVHAACLYSAPVDRLLPRFKFHDDLAAGRLLSQLMAEAFARPAAARCAACRFRCTRDACARAVTTRRWNSRGRCRARCGCRCSAACWSARVRRRRNRNARRQRGGGMCGAPSPCGAARRFPRTSCWSTT